MVCYWAIPESDRISSCRHRRRYSGYASRQKVIEYCAKNGEDHVSNIATFGKMFGRMAVQWCYLGLIVCWATAWKLVPCKPGASYSKVSVVLKRMRTFGMNMKIIKPRSSDYTNSVKEGRVGDSRGVVIANTLVNYIAWNGARAWVAAQFPMGEVEELGLLKMDFRTFEPYDY